MDLVPLVGTIMGLSIFLIPVIGFTAHYVLKPFQSVLAEYATARRGDENVHVLERRVALMEQHMELMESTLNRIADASDFHRDLRAPQEATPAIPAPQRP